MSDHIDPEMPTPSILSVCEGNPPGYPKCRDCLTGLARQAADMAAKGDPVLRTKAESAALAVLDRAGGTGWTSPALANRMLRAVTDVTGVSDPYLEFKKHEMDQARRLFEQIKGRVEDHLFARVELAALGNSLDFFRPPEAALAELTAGMVDPAMFYHDDTPRLARFLERRRSLILYLTDNAGEVYFDIPLYQYLRDRADRVLLVMKGGPGLNDLTRDDLYRAGLQDVFDETGDTGAPGAGVEWETASRDFRALMMRADLIVSKGMANFETLYSRSLPSPTFFLFKVKCEPMRDFLHAPINRYMAVWRDGREV